VGVFTTDGGTLTTDIAVPAANRGVFTTNTAVPTIFSAPPKPTMTIHNYIAKREITVLDFDFIVSCLDFSVSCFARYLSSTSMRLLAVMVQMAMAVQQKKGLTPPISSIILVTFAATNPISMTTDHSPIVILALGCNVDAPVNMPRLQAALAARFPSIRFTRQIVTEAIGIEAAPFANCLAWMETDQDYATLHAVTKEIEQQLGSTREDRREGRVVADADILCCGGCRYHADDWQRPYIQTLMAELPRR